MSKKRYKQLLSEKRIIATLSKVLNKNKTDEVKLYNLVPASYIKAQTRKLANK